MIIKCEVGGEHVACDRCRLMLNRHAYGGAPLRVDMNGKPETDPGQVTIAGGKAVAFCTPCWTLLYDTVIPHFADRQCYEDD